MIMQPIDISDATNNALRNLSDKPSRTIGQMISDALSIPASKIHFLAKKYELLNEQKYIDFVNSVVDKVSDIPPEKIITPEPLILGSISDDIVYCVNYDELCDMFSSLLANSCNIDYASIVHPSFSGIIKRMSPYDANLFSKICLHSEFSFDAAEYMILKKQSSEYSVLHECIVTVEEPFSDFEMQSFSISALKHLGLISYLKSDPVSPGIQFEECDYYKKLLEQYKNTDSYPVVRRVPTYLTPYGESFAKACSISAICPKCK